MLALQTVMCLALTFTPTLTADELLFGRIADLSDVDFVVEVSDDVKHQVEVCSDTVYIIDGQPGTLADLRMGLDVSLVVQNHGEYYLAMQITAHSPSNSHGPTD